MTDEMFDVYLEKLEARRKKTTTSWLDKVHNDIIDEHKYEMQEVRRQTKEYEREIEISKRQTEEYEREIEISERQIEVNKHQLEEFKRQKVEIQREIDEKNAEMVNINVYKTQMLIENNNLLQ